MKRYTWTVSLAVIALLSLSLAACAARPPQNQQGVAGAEEAALKTFVPGGQLDECQALPVEAALDGHRADDVLSSELEEQLPRALDLPRLEQERGDVLILRRATGGDEIDRISGRCLGRKGTADLLPQLGGKLGEHQAIGLQRIGCAPAIDAVSDAVKTKNEKTKPLNARRMTCPPSMKPGSSRAAPLRGRRRSPSDCAPYILIPNFSARAARSWY